MPVGETFDLAVNLDASNFFRGLSDMNSAMNTVVGMMSAASDMAVVFDRTLARVSAVFQENAGSIESWASAYSANMGRSSSETLKFASDVGTFLTELGFGHDRILELSERLVTLSNDLSAFNGIDPAYSMRALDLAVAGNIRSLRQYGIAVNQHMVDQELMNMGFQASKVAVSVADQAIHAHVESVMRSAAVNGQNIVVMSEAQKNLLTYRESLNNLNDSLLRHSGTLDRAGRSALGARDAYGRFIDQAHLGRPILTDHEMAIYRSVEATKAYDASLGHMRETITENDRAQARLNVILRESEVVSGAAARMQNTFWGQMQQIRGTIIDLAVSVGRDLNDAVLRFLLDLGGMAKVNEILHVGADIVRALGLGFLQLKFSAVDALDAAIVYGRQLNDYLRDRGVWDYLEIQWGKFKVWAADAFQWAKTKARDLYLYLSDPDTQEMFREYWEEIKTTVSEAFHWAEVKAKDFYASVNNPENIAAIKRYWEQFKESAQIVYDILKGIKEFIAWIRGNPPVSQNDINQSTENIYRATQAAYGVDLGVPAIQPGELNSRLTGGAVSGPSKPGASSSYAAPGASAGPAASSGASSTTSSGSRGITMVNNFSFPNVTYLSPQVVEEWVVPVLDRAQRRMR